MASRIEFLTGTPKPLVVDFAEDTFATKVTLGGELVGNVESVNMTFTAHSSDPKSVTTLKASLTYGRSSSVREDVIAAFKAAGFIVDVRVLTDG